MNVIFCSTHVLRSRLIDGDACKQCKVSLVVSGVMGGRLSLGHALTLVKECHLRLTDRINMKV